MENSLTAAVETIFALSSAPGRAAIAVIRISGPNANFALQKLARRMPPPRQAALVDLVDPKTGQPLDSALTFRFVQPASATGEDSVEFHVHGGRAVVAGVLRALGTLPGFRAAEPGEFARRAFANGKLDLTQAEGLADLIDAETEYQRVQAFRQSRGLLASLYNEWRDRLIEAMALTEAAIDFSDEGDVAENALTDARSRAEDLRAELAAHLTDARRGEIVRSGFRVVLAGPVNAGKSTLLNWLAKRDAAITSEEPGTTRDVIEVKLDVDGLPVVVLDTAGVRDAAGAVEREGIRRSRAQMETADLVLWLSPVSGGDDHQTDAPPPTSTVVRTKIDLDPGVLAGARAISVETGAGLSEFMDWLSDHVRDRLDGTDEPVITQVRHRQHVAAALDHIDAFIGSGSLLPELAAEELRLAATEIGRLTGRVDPEDVLGAIFGRFCIGK